MIVGIDPGHGGQNHGCTGSGLHEEVLTLQTAMSIRSAMLQRDAATHVILSREVDETLSLAGRAIRLSRADFILSLHYDSAAGPTEGSIGAYCFPDDAIAEAAGAHARKYAPEVLRGKDGHVNQVNPMDWTVRAYNVLMHHRPKPALLIEVAFLSNLKHVEYLRGAHAMQEISTLLCDVIGVGLAKVVQQRAQSGPENA